MKDFYFYLSVFTGFLILVLLAFIVFNSGGEFKYKVERSGVEFVSNTADPGELLDSFRNAQIIVFSPQFVESGPENSYMANALTVFNSVLVAKGKKVVVVARVLDDKGNIKSCQTNYGDPKKGEELTAQDCAAMLSSGAPDPVIFFSLPDSRLQKPRAVLSKGNAAVSPSSFDNVSYTSFVFLSSLYPDAQSIIEGVNSVVKKL
ncbi:Uncharacterised protein [uncultured archaeon]|nr:Uncharacterised protein [uncultured archaeon]